MEKLKQAAMQQGMKLMQSPKVAKLMSDPRFMKMMMQAMQMPGKVKAQVDASTATFAKTFGLATRTEIATLKDTIRSLESSIHTLEQKLTEKPEKASKSSK